MVSAFVCLHLSTAAVLPVTKALNHALISSCSVVIFVLLVLFCLQSVVVLCFIFISVLLSVMIGMPSALKSPLVYLLTESTRRKLAKCGRTLWQCEQRLGWENFIYLNKTARRENWVDFILLILRLAENLLITLKR